MIQYNDFAHMEDTFYTDGTQGIGTVQSNQGQRRCRLSRSRQLRRRKHWPDFRMFDHHWKFIKEKELYFIFNQVDTN